MTFESSTHTATAVITTAKAARYEKQLVSHMGHKIDIDARPHGHIFHFSEWGPCEVRAYADRLVFEASGIGHEELGRIQHAMTKHLLQFATREDLSIEWVPGIAAQE